MDVIDTIVESFPEYMLHIGGDEVQYACWHNDLVCMASYTVYLALIFQPSVN